MLSKILKIIIILIVLAALGVGAYWFFDRQQGGGDSIFGDNLSVGDFFPFGSSNTDPTTNTPTPIDTSTTTPSTNTQIPIEPPRLWQISTEPQAGAVAFNASGTPTVRFVDKATGNIFEASLHMLGLKRISNTTIPKVYEALWQPNGRAVVMRYLDENNETVKSTLGKISDVTGSSNSSDTVQEIQATFLADNIAHISTNTNGAFGYIVKNPNNAQIFTTNTSSGDIKQIFESPIKDWIISWVGNNTLGLSSKPSADATGQFYFFKMDGSLTRVLGGRPGLMALANPAGTKIFYTESRNNSFTSAIYDPATGMSTPTPFAAIPDKCVWSTRTAYLYCATPRTIPSGKYPDNWYQGKVSFNDEIWRIETSSGSTEFLIDPKTVETDGVDGINLTLDPDEEYLVFTNKKDSQLWGLKISNN